MLIRRGARGEQVKDIQKALNDKGFGQVGVDGIFGRGTESAVRRFQKASGLGVDGIVGPSTRSALQAAQAQSEPVVTDDPPPIIGVLQSKNYPVHTDGQVNIIGVRSSNAVANSFDDAMHRSKYETLCQRAGKVRVWRDNNRDNTLDWGHDEGQAGYYGINLHHAGENSTRVENWSAGCQVFARLADWEEAMSIWKASGAELFTYTLITEEDIN